MGKSNKTTRSPGKSRKDKEKGTGPSQAGGTPGNIGVQNPTGPVVGQDPIISSVPATVVSNPPVHTAGNQEEVAESSTAARPSIPVAVGDGVAERTVNQTDAVPSAREQWDALKQVMTQLALLTSVIAPAPVVQMTGNPIGVHPMVGNQIGTVHRGMNQTEENVDEENPEVVEINPPTQRSSKKKVDYLSVLEHITRLGTKQFQGCSDPIEADEWKSRLTRNFSSTRCPEDYKKDIAVHFLEKDAHNWWLAYEKRNGDQLISFADFEREFNKKFFPPEAWDRLECAFLDLVQGNRTVREYEEEFNRLRRYVGRELEDEQAQVRRFIRGLRVEIRNHCLVRTFNSVSELVERAAMIEIGIEEENQLKQARFNSRSNPISKSGEKKRKWDKVENSNKSSGKRPECETCGKKHGGECWKAIGACARCGNKEHSTQNCPRMDQGTRATSDDARTCFHCGKTGHFKRECPKLQVEKQAGQNTHRGRNDPTPPAKRQAGAPRVYELSKETSDAGTFTAITGTL